MMRIREHGQGKVKPQEQSWQCLKAEARAGEEDQ